MRFSLRPYKLLARRKKAALTLTIGSFGLAVLFTNCGQPIASSEIELYSQNLERQIAAIDDKIWPDLNSDQNENLVVKVDIEDPYNFMGSFYGDAMTVVMLIETKKLRENLFLADSGADFEANRVDFATDKFVFEKISTRQTADHSLTYKTEKFTAEQKAAKYMVVAARFYTEDNVTLYLNGLRLNVAAQVKGSPTPFSYLMKTFQFSPAVVKGVLYKKALTSAEVNLISRKYGTLVGLSLPFDDSEAQGPVAPLTPFALAKAVMQTNCFICHSTWATYSEAQFAEGSNPLVVKNNLANSKIYFRLKGVTVGTGPQDMPMNAAALSTDDVAIIENWIKSIK